MLSTTETVDNWILRTTGYDIRSNQGVLFMDDDPREVVLRRPKALVDRDVVVHVDVDECGNDTLGVEFDAIVNRILLRVPEQEA
jgi:hypothetical protein